MHTHVADDAVGVFLEGAPAAWVGDLVESAHGGGAGPEVPVEVIGDGGTGLLGGGAAAHVVVAADFGMGDAAEFPGVDDFVFGVDEVWGGSALGADLDDAFVFACGGEDGLAFGDVDGDGFLQVEVGAGFDGIDGGEGVPMVGGGDEDEVGFLFGEEFLVVLVGGGRFFRDLAGGDEVGGFGYHLAIDIAEADDVDGGDLDEAEEVGFAVPAGADEGDAFYEVGEIAIAGGVAFGEVDGLGGGGGGEGGFGESAAVHGGSSLVFSR